MLDSTPRCCCSELTEASNFRVARALNARSRDRSLQGSVRSIELFAVAGARLWIADSKTPTGVKHVVHESAEQTSTFEALPPRGRADSNGRPLAPEAGRGMWR